jgi:hypothetical protein
MPLNEIEQHPYLEYFILFHNGEDNIPWDKYTRMFIGSFPVYQVTKTIYPVIQDRSLIEKENILPFFYGSPNNLFWQLITWCFINNIEELKNFDRNNKDKLVQFLEMNQIILTDIISCTNRNIVEKNKPHPYSSLDQALLNNKAEINIVDQFQFNYKIIEWLEKAKNINSIYFTSQKRKEGKNPGGWFHRVITNKAIPLTVISEAENSLTYYLGGTINREIKLFFLPSPASYRSINLNAKKQPHFMFQNYIHDISPEFLAEIKSKNYSLSKSDKSRLKLARENFIKEWWFQFVIYQNENYNGTVN